MADALKLTETIARVVTPTDTQPLYTALDVLEYDALDFLVTVSFETPGASPTLSLVVSSGMQRASSDGWLVVGGFPSALTPSPNNIGVFSLTGGFYRYICWQATAFSGATAAMFTIDVVGRRNA